MSRHLSQCWVLPLGRGEGNGHVTTQNMVSRRKILSQSRDELSYVQEEEEDVWYTKDKLYKVEIHISIENLLICLLCHKAMMCIIDLYLA